MKIRNTEFDLKNNTYVMGILNVTPDSFSDGGLHNTTESAISHALSMIEDGAAIIDIGGESTRPGYESVPDDVESERVIPVIRALRKISDVAISVDTTKASVAAAAVAEGADIINSVAGLGADDEMLKTVKDSDAYFVMTYENNYVNQFGEALIGMAERAVEAGIAAERIIVDPGIGFGKSATDNLKIINELPIITQIGYPILLGCSRKSFIAPFTSPTGSVAKDRLPGTIVTTVLAGLAGVGIVRVHDVKENFAALSLLRGICES